MTTLRLLAALAVLTCLTGFSWPDSSPSDAAPAEDATAAEQLDAGTIEDRVVRLGELARRAELSNATLAHVRELLFSPVEELRAAAVEVLGRHGRQSDEQLLIRLLSDSSDDVQLAAATTISAFGSRASAVALAGLLDEQSTDVRVEALKTLAIFAQPATMFPVLDLLLSHDPRVEIEAIRALGEIGDPRAVPALAVRLESPEYAASLAAGDALAQIDTVDSVRAVLIHAAGLRPQLMANHEMGYALKLASTSTIVEAIMAMGGNETLQQILQQMNLPADTIRALYTELGERVPFAELSHILKFEAALLGVDDERLTLDILSDRAPHVSIVTPQDGETLADSCVAERVSMDFESGGYQYRDPAAARHDQLISLRSIFMVCGEEHTAAVVGAIPPDIAAQLVQMLLPGDPLRAWLLQQGSDWGEDAGDMDATWTYFEALRDSESDNIAAHTSVRFSENALGAILAFGWGTPSFADFLDLMSNEALRSVPTAWKTYARRTRTTETGRRDETTDRSQDDVLASLQVSLSECSALSPAIEQAVEGQGSPWAKNLRDLHSIFCPEVSAAARREEALARRTVPTSADAAIEYAPGANASEAAATLWKAAVDGELSSDEIDRCVRYALGDAPDSVRIACLLAADRAEVRFNDDGRMLANLRQRVASPIASGPQTNRPEHTILISDRATGMGVWGAPLLLFLNDGTTIRTTTGAYGFLAVPSDIVAGVAPQ